MINQNSKFGAKAEFKRPNNIACCFQCVNDRTGKPALNVDMTSNTNNIPDWKNKITIQLKINELSMLCAMFLKTIPECNFAYHGENNNKSLIAKIIKNKEDHSIQFNFIMFSAGQKKGYIFLTQQEAFMVFKLALTQLCFYFNQSETEILNSIKCFY